jgi:cytoskeletal protein RodZ
MPTGAQASAVSALPDLSAIRKRRGITLEEIAQSTKISTRYLEAIERSEFAILPGGVFSTSYIRQYARAIEYDEWDLLAYYDATTRTDEEPVGVVRECRVLGVFRVPDPILRLFAPEKRV